MKVIGPGLRTPELAGLALATKADDSTAATGTARMVASITTTNGTTNMSVITAAITSTKIMVMATGTITTITDTAASKRF